MSFWQVNMYFTDKNLMQWGTPCNWISKVLKWNIPTDRAQRVDEKNGGVRLVMSTPRVMVF